MCLAVPGLIVDLTEDTPLTRTGRVAFGTVVRQVNLSAVPEAGVGDYVLVHAGLAICVVHPEDAAQTIDRLCDQQAAPDIEETRL